MGLGEYSPHPPDKSLAIKICEIVSEASFVLEGVWQDSDSIQVYITLPGLISCSSLFTFTADVLTKRRGKPHTSRQHLPQPSDRKYHIYAIQ